MLRKFINTWNQSNSGLTRSINVLTGSVAAAILLIFLNSESVAQNSKNSDTGQNNNSGITINQQNNSGPSIGIQHGDTNINQYNIDEDRRRKAHDDFTSFLLSCQNYLAEIEKLTFEKALQNPTTVLTVSDFIYGVGYQNSYLISVLGEGEYKTLNKRMENIRNIAGHLMSAYAIGSSQAGRKLDNNKHLQNMVAETKQKYEADRQKVIPLTTEHCNYLAGLKKKLQN